MDSPSDLRASARVAVGGELILTTSDWHGVSSAVNLVQQLKRFQLDRQVLLLADVRDTCVRARRVWAWLACGHSRGVPGFGARYQSLGQPLVDMWSLWSAKWLVLARLVELGLNVMSAASAGPRTARLVGVRLASSSAQRTWQARVRRSRPACACRRAAGAQ